MRQVPVGDRSKMNSLSRAGYSHSLSLNFYFLYSRYEVYRSHSSAPSGQWSIGGGKGGKFLSNASKTLREWMVMPSSPFANALSASTKEKNFDGLQRFKQPKVERKRGILDP